MSLRRLLKITEKPYTTASDPSPALRFRPAGDSVLRITVAVSSTAKFRINNGTTDLVFSNDDVLKPAAICTFVISVRENQVYVFKFSADLTIHELIVDEVEGEVI